MWARSPLLVWLIGKLLWTISGKRCLLHPWCASAKYLAHVCHEYSKGSQSEAVFAFAAGSSTKKWMSQRRTKRMSRALRSLWACRDNNTALGVLSSCYLRPLSSIGANPSSVTTPPNIVDLFHQEQSQLSSFQSMARHRSISWALRNQTHLLSHFQAHWIQIQGDRATFPFWLRQLLCSSQIRSPCFRY